MTRSAQVVRLLRGRRGRAMPRPVRRLLAANTLPRPEWLKLQRSGLALLFRGAAPWVAGTSLAALVGGSRARAALKALLPALLGTMLVAQYGLKRVIRRPRPLSSRIRQAVLGRQHAGSSFPSGDAAVNGAAAWVLSTVWPHWSPLFVALGAFGAASRVLAGSHRLSDAGGGVLVGIAVAEPIRRLIRRVWQ